MDIPFDVLWTRQFQIAWGKLSYELESTGNVEVLDAKIADAIAQLEKSGPDLLDPYKPGRSHFKVRIDDEYVLVVRWRTDTDGEGHFFAPPSRFVGHPAFTTWQKNLTGNQHHKKEPGTREPL